MDDMGCLNYQRVTEQLTVCRLDYSQHNLPNQTQHNKQCVARVSLVCDGCHGELK